MFLVQESLWIVYSGLAAYLPEFFFITGYPAGYRIILPSRISGASLTLNGIFIQVEDISRKISVVFRVLVLTVPSQYLVAYFTFWQFRVTQLDAVLGIIMLVVQVVL